jgi:hypothetical protein
MAAPDSSSPRQYAPQERVPISGVYRVMHDQHRADHLVTAIFGEDFPRCRKCGNLVRFQLWMEIEYMPRDWDLSGPNLQLLKPITSFAF